LTPGSGDLPDPDRFEQRALRITGSVFYLLAAGLMVTALFCIYQGHRPVTTLWGVIIAVISIVAMWVLAHYKVKVGTALNSPAILADAACTRTCMQLSAILLASSAGYSLTGIGYLDAVGSILISVLSFREGKEAFQKAKGLSCSCQCGCG
jgi:divalent metal cation (Fe/Co/Zn/Cd) transporter